MKPFRFDQQAGKWFDHFGRRNTTITRIAHIAQETAIRCFYIAPKAYWTPISSISFDDVIIMEPYNANRRGIGLRRDTRHHKHSEEKIEGESKNS